MRFNKTEEIHIDALFLDEANYRFMKAADQNDCIKQICQSGEDGFKRLMKSIAEDDISEPILVYRNDKNENIIADGNRRMSALKVLHKPSIAPNKRLQSYAETLTKKNNLEFNKIQAHVSSDKELINKTVYERHAGATGLRRINWNAYASARFSFNHNLSDPKQSQIMSLLMLFEEKNQDYNEFILSTNFSYEVFRRAISAAIQKDIISNKMFTEKGKIIRTLKKPAVDDAVNKIKRIISSMKSNELNLSRSSDTFADAGKVDEYFAEFSPAPEIAIPKKKEKTQASNNKSTQKNNLEDQSKKSDTTNSTEKENNTVDLDELDDLDDLDDLDVVSNVNDKGIIKSNEICKKLNEFNSRKLKDLYKSLYTVSIKQHPVLMYGGAWSFFEILKIAHNDNKEAPDDFCSYFTQHLPNLMSIHKKNDKREYNDLHEALKHIANTGNLSKHSLNYQISTADQLKENFILLENLILAIIENIIAKKPAEVPNKDQE